MSETEEDGLRAVALQNARSILAARAKAEQDLIEAKRALAQQAQELFQQGEWLRVTLQSIGDAVIATDTQTRITFMNPVAEQLTAWSASQAAGEPLHDVFRIVNETTRLPAPNPVEAVLRTGAVLGVANHTALVSREGLEVIIEDSAAPIKDSTGTIVGAVIVFHDATEKYRQLDRIKRNEQLLSEFFDSASAAIHRLSPDGTILRANRAALMLLGLSMEDYVGHQFADFLIDRSRHDEVMQKITRGQPLHGYELRIRHRDGSIKDIELSCDAFMENGQLVHAHCFLRDITEQRRAERAVRAAESRKDAILNAAADAIFTIDHEGKIGDINAAFERILGYRRSAWEGKRLIDLLSPEIRNDGTLNTLLRHLSDDASEATHQFALQVRHADGHQLPASLSISPVRGHAPLLFSARLRDTTDEKSAQLIAMRLASIVENSDDAIIGKTLDGTITNWNKSAESIFGYSAAEMVGESIMKIVPHERQSEEREILARLGQGERVQNYETIRRTKDGRHIDVALTSSPIRDWRGRIVGASKIVRDISERKKTERMLAEQAKEREKLLESERAARASAEHMSKMKDEFLATVSHELRTPLSAILGWTQLLKRAKANQIDVDKAVEVIDRNARAQVQLIEDLLDMSRIISGKVRLDIQNIDPASAIDAALETVRPAAMAKGVNLERALHKKTAPISADPSRIQQIVWNLLSNAIKFTPKGGQVCVALEAVDSTLQISVSDTGAGINPDFLPHVFERFRQADASTTRKHEGLGLGLAIVRHLVELHGGTVAALSDGENRGATFMVRLPISAVQQYTSDTNAGENDIAQSQHVMSQPNSLAGISILVVDDVADARELLKRLLEEFGARVNVAGSGDEALQMIRAERPDVLVSDVGMPNMDGYELLRLVRAMDDPQAEELPAIALTAFARAEDRIRALRAGFRAHVPKPVEPAELIETIATVVKRH